jgi:O-antigen/teichoic acid export membrane protein
MPGELLHGLIRPVLIAWYVRTREFARLNELAMLVWKFSALTLAPVICALAVAGPQLLSTIRADYAPAAPLVLALCGLLMLRLHSVQLGTIVNAIDRPQLMTIATAASTLALVPFVAMLVLGVGEWSYVIAIAIAESVLNLVVLYGLDRAGWRYRFDRVGAARLACAIVVVCTVPLFLPTARGTAESIAAAVAAALVCLIGAVKLGVMTPSDRNWLSKLVSNSARS